MVAPTTACAEGGDSGGSFISGNQAQGVTSGHLPYLALPAIGWDFAGRTGRGYVQGRFRGTAEVYAEAEWRFRITDNGLLGGVVFANMYTFTRPAVSYPGYTEPGESLFEESLAPLRHNLSAEIKARSNLIVAIPLGGEEDDLGSNHISIRQRMTTRLLL